jgi:DNA-binding transcriptional ArsR family regulator
MQIEYKRPLTADEKKEIQPARKAMGQAKGILDRLFTSRARARLITVLFMDPEREFYMRELARATDQVIGSVQRELGNLEEMDLVISQRRANAKYYRANKRHYLFRELRSIVSKTTSEQVA